MKSIPRSKFLGHSWLLSRGEHCHFFSSSTSHLLSQGLMSRHICATAHNMSMVYWQEIEGKQVHDPFFRSDYCNTTSKVGRCISIPGPIIVGAGPSGLAVAACLKEKGIESLVLERSNCIASLWQHKTYDRLRLHLPKKYCELPLMPFPADFPKYPSKQQFISYLENYARQFDIQPQFNETVVSAEYDESLGLWRVRTVAREGKGKEVEYVSRWLIVSTGENAEEVVPEIEGMKQFKGPVLHTSAYRSGDLFRGKRVLVVGGGNSGMEVCLDLCNYHACPTIVIRNAVHILPREMLGLSTFGLSMWLLKWLPIRIVDQILLLIARIVLGDTTRLGLLRPVVGPLEAKLIFGKTPVLDIGTLSKIKSGEIQVRPAIKRLRGEGAEFADGSLEKFDAIILATGYKSNVPSWLKERKFFSENDGLPKNPFPNGWKGEHGLYAVGLTKRGLMGSSMDARRIALDIEQIWKTELH